ncbi:hypothetical protein Hypma_000363 [Hypsizygus marmoreus]|uniref:F-box domain-containing protein n=1 Tax=Hypsizygus marmoreus TaxID=39966 RepID=A0A369JHR1_HYPMA|nr:hypothetical protein Hypma_000363 [Hypsizygus marmoreus]
MPLLQLQDDILLRIFQTLPQKELYALALLCRRLNHISLTLFLERENIIIGPTSAIEIRPRSGKHLDALSALLISQFVPAISRLSFHFHQSFYPAFLHGITRLWNFISRLSSIEELHLVVPSSTFEMEPSYEGLRKMLSSKSCSRFTIQDSRGDLRVYVPQAISFARPIKSRSFKGAFLGILRPSRTQPGLQRWPSLSHSSTSTSHNETHPPHPLTLSSLAIHQQDSLLPGRIAHTLSVLRTTTSLTLACTGFSDDEWTSLLSQLSPVCFELTTLEVHTRDIKPRDLLKFIGRLPKLSSLSIHGFARLGLVRQIRTCPILPLLTTLAASPEYASLLLAGNRAMPRLKSLQILLTSCTDLTRRSCEETVSEIMQHMSRRRLMPTLVIDFNFDARWMKAGMAVTIDRCWGRSPGLGRAFSALTKLTIVGYAPLGASGYELRTLILPRWLRLFPSLVRLSFTGDDPDQSVQRVYPLLDAIHLHCPQIQTVNIGSECHDVLASLKLVATLAKFDNAASGGVAKIFDLTKVPEDVLYLIFANLPGNDLYTLANLSRYLRHIVLPIYLRKRGIPEPTISTTLRAAEDASFAITDISALNLSSSVQSIGQLSCTITNGVSHFVAYETLHRLHRLVLKLSTIGEFTLDFRGLAHSHDQPTALDKKWPRLMTAILDALVQKSCASVTILGGSSFEHGIKDLARRNAGQEGPAECPHWAFSHSLIQKAARASNAPPPSRGRLQEFELESETLRIPALSGWMTSTLWGSQFTHLSVTRLSQAIGPILSSIAEGLPNLTDLHMAGASIPPHDVLDFINKFPHLASLSLDAGLSSEAGVIEMSGRVPRLQHLQKLSAPKDYVGFLLLPVNPLPDLEHLTIRVPKVAPFLMSNYLRSLSSIITHLQDRDTLPTICLSVPLISAEWIGHQGMLNVGWSMFSWSVTAMTLAHVELSEECSLVSDPSSCLPAWLSFFPNLRHLTFDGQCSIRDLAYASQDIIWASPSLLTLGVTGDQRECSWWEMSSFIQA